MSIRQVIIFIISSVISSLGLAAELRFHSEPSHKEMGLPFSKATQVGDLLFLSGELGIDPKTGKLAPGGIKPETKQVMENIAATLDKYGSSLDKVAKCTVFLADIGEWAAFNEVYVTFFHGNYPARSAMAGSGLAFNARVEVECIAVVAK